MKIVHINLSGTWRGGERQVFLLMQGLKVKNIDQVLICRKNSALEERCSENGLPFVSINRSISISTFRVLEGLEEKGYDILHCHESKGHTLGIIYKTLFPSKQKLVLHRRVIFPIKQKITTSIKYSQKHISKIICISSAVEKAVNESINFDETVVIPSMVPIKELPPSTGVLRQQFGIRAHKIIGYIAALTYEKDHFTFIDTAKKLLDSGRKDLHFVIIGEGNLKEELMVYSQKLNLQHQLTFTGFLSEIDTIIPDIDLLLFTSVSEGLGSTILDFFVAKKPVVCVESGGAEELVFDGKTGFICKRGDSDALCEKVKILLDNPKMVEEITTNAHQFVTGNFSVEKITAQTLEVYHRV